MPISYRSLAAADHMLTYDTRAWCDHVHDSVYTSFWCEYTNSVCTCYKPTRCYLLHHSMSEGFWPYTALLQYLFTCSPMTHHSAIVAYRPADSKEFTQVYTDQGGNAGGNLAVWNFTNS